MGHPLSRKSSENVRLSYRRAEAGLQEIEVAAFVRLLDMPREHPAIAALIAGLLCRQAFAAPCELCVGHLQRDGARWNIDCDGVAGSHQCQRPPDERFWRDVEDASTVAGAAHA